MTNLRIMYINIIITFIILHKKQGWALIRTDQKLTNWQVAQLNTQNSWEKQRDKEDQFKRQVVKRYAHIAKLETGIGYLRSENIDLKSERKRLQNILKSKMQ